MKVSSFDIRYEILGFRRLQQARAEKATGRDEEQEIRVFTEQHRVSRRHLVSAGSCSADIVVVVALVALVTLVTLTMATPAITVTITYSALLFVTSSEKAGIECT